MAVMPPVIALIRMLSTPAGRAKTAAAQHYVLHDLQLFADKYVKAWNNVGLNIFYNN
jgi:hypothetical protein